MKKFFDVLRKCALFDHIEDADLLPLLGCTGAKVLRFEKRSPIIREGQPAENIGIVLSGAAQIERIDYFGNRSIISDVSPPQMFGEAFACAEVRFIPVSVTAADDSEIMLIDCRRVLHSCNNACPFHQQMIFNLMKDMATKNIMFHQKIEITSKRTTREKLMAYLLMQAKKCSSSSFDIPFDRQELADYLGVDRSGLSAEIGRMRKEGLIKNQKNRFVLLCSDFADS